MRKHTLLALLAFGSITLSSCYVDLGFIQFGKKVYDEKAQNKRIAEYYKSISSDLKGQDLLDALTHLNLKSRTKTVGYESMSTTPAGLYKFTDYDPATVKFTDSGIPYGTKILSFYSGKSVTKFDREHVWPASRLSGGRNGNIVDDDIFMPRPTCSEENQDRGNSVYMTGANDPKTGFDPITAFKSSIGVAEGIHGECARIIFYTMTCDSSLKLSDSNAYTPGCATMGVLTDMVEWACEDKVTDREKRRQVGGEYLQGNRNAFVDHPEYVCKIWGNHNDKTKAACSKAGYETN